ncbi:unnamed protein product, partial [Meganyctiphanes norvegica]
MDFLECKICHVPYDEEDHRPRHAPCGHEVCTACVKALIKNGIFECPKCRQKNKVDVPSDMPVVFGLIDVIRAFKTRNIPMPNETEPSTSGTSNAEVCKVHHKAIGHRCLKCQMWLCQDCLESHSTLIGCSTISSSNAVNGMKEQHKKDINILRTLFEEDESYVSSKIQEHTDNRKELLEKAEKHSEEIEKFSKLLEKWKIHKEKFEESITHLDATNSPLAVMDKIEVLTQSKQSLRSWSVKNLGTHSQISLLKALEEELDVYVELVIKEEKKHGRLSKHEENIYFHTLRTETITDGCICIPYELAQKMIPVEASLAFLEISHGGIVKGNVIVRLDKELPIIREHFAVIVSGQSGLTLRGANMNFTYTPQNDDSGCCIGATDLKFSEIKVTP